MLEVLNTLRENVMEMRLLVEGAIALFEDEWDTNPKDTADMMGQALYMLRVYTQGCQKALYELATAPIKGEE